MNRKKILILIALILLIQVSGHAFHTRLFSVDHNTIFQKSFIRDYEVAQQQIESGESMQPMLNLLKKYHRPEEVAELELTIGLAYNQGGGFVDPEKAIVHLTKALEFKLPERTIMEIFVWRGGSFEQLKNYKESLKDYLRVLLAATYYDINREWPEIKPPKTPIYTNSIDPENKKRIRDYNEYRNRLNHHRFILTQRYFMVDAIKRVRKENSIGEKDLVDILGNLTPDTYAIRKVRSLLNEENKRPWP